jgi:hypothetical protein
MPADQRKIIGSTVHALACHVTALSECTRRYGSHNKKKLLDGVVLRVETKPTPMGRTSTLFVAKYKLGPDGVMKTKGINIRSVKARAAPLLPGEADREEDYISVPVAVVVPVRRGDDAGSTDTSTAVSALIASALEEDDDDDDDDDYTPPDTDDSIRPDQPDDLPDLESVHRCRSAAAATAPVQEPGTTAAVATTTAPVATVHEQEWFKPGQGGPIKLKKVTPCQWKVTNQFGDDVYPNSPASLRMSRLVLGWHVG